MNILAFDTSGNNLSTGLLTESGFFEENRTSGLKHSENLLPSVKRLTERAGTAMKELDLIVCSRGPGSFTGLRIGMATAKGLSSGCGAPVVSVNILDAFAFGLDFFQGAVVPVIDARKNKFYSAVYLRGQRESDYLDLSEEELLSITKEYEYVLFTGPGSDLIKKRFSTAAISDGPKLFYFEERAALASVLIKIGRRQFESLGPDSDDCGPLYIRLSDAELSKL